MMEFILFFHCVVFGWLKWLHHMYVSYFLKNIGTTRKSPIYIIVCVIKIFLNIPRQIMLECIILHRKLSFAFSHIFNANSNTNFDANSDANYNAKSNILMKILT